MYHNLYKSLYISRKFSTSLVNSSFISSSISSTSTTSSTVSSSLTNINPFKSKGKVVTFNSFTNIGLIYDENLKDIITVHSSSFSLENINKKFLEGNYIYRYFFLILFFLLLLLSNLIFISILLIANEKVEYNYCQIGDKYIAYNLKSIDGYSLVCEGKENDIILNHSNTTTNNNNDEDIININKNNNNILKHSNQKRDKVLNYTNYYDEINQYNNNKNNKNNLTYTQLKTKLSIKDLNLNKNNFNNNKLILNYIKNNNKNIKEILINDILQQQKLQLQQYNPVIDSSSSSSSITNTNSNTISSSLQRNQVYYTPEDELDFVFLDDSNITTDIYHRVTHMGHDSIVEHIENNTINFSNDINIKNSILDDHNDTKQSSISITTSSSSLSSSANNNSFKKKSLSEEIEKIFTNTSSNTSTENNNNNNNSKSLFFW